MAELPCLPWGKTFHSKGQLSACFWIPQRAKQIHLWGKKKKWSVQVLQAAFADTWHQSCTSVLPAATTRSGLPFPDLSWKRLSLCCSEIVGTSRSLRKAMDFRSFSFTCLQRRADTKRQSLSHLAVLFLHWATAGVVWSWANSANSFSGTQFMPRASGHQVAYTYPFILWLEIKQENYPSSHPVSCKKRDMGSTDPWSLWRVVKYRHRLIKHCIQPSPLFLWCFFCLTALVKPTMLMCMYSHGHTLQQNLYSIAWCLLASPSVSILKVGAEVLSSTDVLETPWGRKVCAFAERQQED